MSDEKRWNPYIAMLPCCGKVACLKCIEIAERINEALDSGGSDEACRYGERQSKRLNKHMDTFDHTGVEVHV
jgi:hypothetical protein